MFHTYNSSKDHWTINKKLDLYTFYIAIQPVYKKHLFR